MLCEDFVYQHSKAYIKKIITRKHTWGTGVPQLVFSVPFQSRWNLCAEIFSIYRKIIPTTNKLLWWNIWKCWYNVTLRHHYFDNIPIITWFLFLVVDKLQRWTCFVCFLGFSCPETQWNISKHCNLDAWLCTSRSRDVDLHTKYFLSLAVDKLRRFVFLIDFRVKLLSYCHTELCLSTPCLIAYNWN